ncbi:hypothetical protein H0H87_011692 [Tephrocybe sp. NHM501043]|nr:hypothetical protein H0H87_011692 [Tephrocybe sp. NHM501043]
MAFADVHDPSQAANFTAPTTVAFHVNYDNIFQRGPVVEEGGRILDKQRALLTEELLWVSASRQARFRKFQQQKKIDRISKKKTQDIARRAHVSRTIVAMNINAIITSLAPTPSSSTAVTNFEEFGEFTDLSFQNDNHLGVAGDPAAISTAQSTDLTNEDTTMV